MNLDIMHCLRALIVAGFVAVASPAALAGEAAFEALPPINFLPARGFLAAPPALAAAGVAQAQPSAAERETGYPLMACYRRTETILAPCIAPRSAPTDLQRWGEVEVGCLLSERSMLSNCIVLVADFEALKSATAVRRAIAASGPMTGLNGISEVWLRLAVPLDEALILAESNEAAEKRARTPVRQGADWITRPTAAQMAAAYPPRASDAGIGGQASLRCRITEAAMLVDCRAEQESPRGEGFGEAALTLTPYMQFSAAVEDAKPTSDEIVIPVNFNPPRPGVLGRLLGN